MKNILFAIVTVFSLIACSGNTGFKYGQAVTVTEKCIWASNEDTYEQMCKYCNRRDEKGLEIMEARGQIGILWSGVTGIVTELKFAKTKIRLEDGREVWIANEFLK